MGNPFLLATDFTPTVTFGLVSGVHRYQYPAGTLLEYTDCIQIDTSINPGNSGGPLFNMEGELIGINGRGSFDKRGRVNSGVGYAISINQIKNFLGHLHAGIDTDHATLGAMVKTVGDAKTTSRGCQVQSILEDSDAARRGLQRRRAGLVRRPADHERQPVQERARHLPEGLADAADLSPRQQEDGDPRPADGRAAEGYGRGRRSAAASRPTGSQPTPRPPAEGPPSPARSFTRPRKASRITTSMISLKRS